ncbi:protein of unknown function [Bartonella clarridgeiae 73]|uniref:Uncharacterized protein n=1 Tax=Bartonella clarridgeiae (strain CCUG 45776 / CIP 104772 / 73) TaxID=696125 RepID=E6YIF8_BARC7|nr:protein of unknown function [Bartonella clarridgeiae 73]
MAVLYIVSEALIQIDIQELVIAMQLISPKFYFEHLVQRCGVLM